MHLKTDNKFYIKGISEIFYWNDRGSNKSSFRKRMVGITGKSCLPISGLGRNKAMQTQSLLRRAKTAEKQFCNDRNAVLRHSTSPVSFYPADLSRSAWIIYTDPRDSKSNSRFFWRVDIHFSIHVGRRFLRKKKKIERSYENCVYCRLVSPILIVSFNSGCFSFNSHLNSITYIIVRLCMNSSNSLSLSQPALLLLIPLKYLSR